LIKIIKTLLKDSLVYGIANIIQKLVPFIIIPIITTYLGKTALKLYDISFIYTYLFSSLVILGLDSAASVFYFDERKTKYNKRQVLSHAFFIQIVSAIFYLGLFFFFGHQFADYAFAQDVELKSFWLLALTIIPGYIFLNYGLAILLWQKRKSEYVLLCVLQTLITILGVYLAVVIFGKGIREVFYVCIGSLSFCGLLAIWLIRKELFPLHFPINLELGEKLVVFGIPFALTSFSRQLIPSIDRFFLLQNHYTQDLPQYILAAKLSSFFSFATSAFVLAFTPYSLNKLNDEDAEKEISELFRFITVLGFLAVPLLLIFKDFLIEFFADSSYSLAAKLFPFFFFGWVFDLFSYFTMLGIYKSQKSFIVLIILAIGVALVTALNILLIPYLGLYGAALSFCITKAALFLITLLSLKKYFHLQMEIKSFALIFLTALVCSYLVYVLKPYIYLPAIFLFACGLFWYVRKTFSGYQIRGFFKLNP
jgi:O-antigen/teichoic acid export membrane protein